MTAADTFTASDLRRAARHAVKVAARRYADDPYQQSVPDAIRVANAAAAIATTATPILDRVTPTQADLEHAVHWYEVGRADSGRASALALDIAGLYALLAVLPTDEETDR